MASSSSTSEDGFSTKKETQSLDFPALAKTLNFNLPIKLDRKNFINWRAQVLAAIRALELDNFISADFIPPSQFLSDSTADTTPKVNPDYRTWRRSDQLLLCWLLSTIGEEVIGQVNQCQTSLEVWKVLEKLYAQTSMVRVLQLKQQLSTIQKGALSISEYMQKIKSIGDALLVSGHPVQEHELILSALNGLGHEYDSVVVLLTHTMISSTLQETQYSLMMHETRLEQLNATNQAAIITPAANSATFNNQTRNNNQGNQGGRSNYRGRGGRGRGGRWSNNSRLYCQLCNKPGHDALRCYKRFDQAWQGNQSNWRSQQTQNTYQGNSQNTNDSPQTYIAHGQLDPAGDNTWFVDTGATNHVTADIQNLSIGSEYGGKEKSTVGNGQGFRENSASGSASGWPLQP